MLGQIKGWRFLGKKLSADGSTSLENLRAEKIRLEKRIAELPTLISQLSHSIELVQNDVNWLKSLNDRRAKNWQQENGKSVTQAIYDGNNILAGYRSKLEGLNTEKTRIPNQIKEIDSQISALIQGESTGLSKGYTGSTAQQLGELELEKQKSLLESQKAIEEVRLQQATNDTSQDKSATTNWKLIIGGTVLLLAVLAFVLYSKSAKSIPLPIQTT